MLASLRTRLVPLLLGVSLGSSLSHAQIEQFNNLRLLNAKLAGHVDDYTRNHGRFNRLPSRILNQRKDLYVYTPPGYCTSRRYPLVLWLHGAFGDEHSFFDSVQLDKLDDDIRCGRLPPMIIACPDGTCSGRNFLFSKHSFYVNGECGRYRDYLVKEVLPFLRQHYAIDPCRRKHAIVGVSAGGLGAMGLALRHYDYFGAVATVSGAINIRYFNVHKDYWQDFSPETFCMRDAWDPNETIGKIGPLRIKAGTFIEPVFGNDAHTAARIKLENPADVLCRSELPAGQLNMLVTYGCHDDFNFDAQAESFVWLARQRGYQVDVLRDANGKHNGAFFLPMQQKVLQWLGPQFQTACESHAARPERPLTSVAQSG